MKKVRKIKSAPKAKSRKPVAKVAAKKKRAAPKKSVVAAAPEKNGFMWKLLERKEAQLKARKLERPDTPWENRYTHLNPKRKAG